MLNLILKYLSVDNIIMMSHLRTSFRDIISIFGILVFLPTLAPYSGQTKDCYEKRKKSC